MRGLVFYANYSLQTRAARPPSFAGSPIPSLGSHASFAKSAPLGQSAYCKNKKTDFFATFLRLRTLSCSREAKTVHHMGNLQRLRADIRILSLCDNPQSQKSCSPGRFFVFKPPKHHWPDAVSGGETDVAPRNGSWSDLHSGGPYRSCWD